MKKILRQRRLQRRLKNIFLFDREIEGSFVRVLAYMREKNS